MSSNTVLPENEIIAYKTRIQQAGRLLYLPIIAQFRVLGILSVSHSTSHPQCTLRLASQIRYIEYELVCPVRASPPRFNFSTKVLNCSWDDDEEESRGGRGYGWNDRLYRSSNVQGQHGIERYPDAECRVESTGTQGVSSSA